MKTALSLSIPCLILLFIVGCAKPVYDTLPAMPEYPAVSATFDTSAYIEFLPDANAHLNDIIKENLRKNGYTNLLPELRFQFHDLNRTRVLQLLCVNNHTYRCKDGCYIEYQVIAVVRQPGEIWNGTLKYANPRYFQAFSRKLWDKDKEEESALRNELLQQAFTNLFSIAEFRSALEPVAQPLNNSGKTSLKKDDFWAMSGQARAAGNDYLATYLAALAAKSGDKSADSFLMENILYSDIFRPSKIVSQIIRHAENGNAVAQNQLALRYLYGKGVAVDHNSALLWFKKAADNNYPEAQYYVGYCYEHGSGTTKDIETALIWYFTAAKNGYNPALQVINNYAINGYAAAQNKLALMYLSGEGVNIAPDKAMHWFKSSACSGYPEAQYYVGYCYEHGIGTAKNIAIAKVWYRSAAKNKYQPAVEKIKLLNK